MFKRKSKSKRMIEATEAKLDVILYLLENHYSKEEEQHGEIYENLIAQKVILKELLHEFKMIQGL